VTAAVLTQLRGSVTRCTLHPESPTMTAAVSKQNAGRRRADVRRSTGSSVALPFDVLRCVVAALPGGVEDDADRDDRDERDCGRRLVDECRERERDESVIRWCRQVDIDDGIKDGLRSAEQAEIVQLRRKARRLDEHPTLEGRLYVCSIKDCCSNRIVGYAIDERMTAQLAVNGALTEDTAQHGRTGTLVPQVWVRVPGCARRLWESQRFA
jgi:transposase InsO family protein